MDDVLCVATQPQQHDSCIGELSVLALCMWVLMCVSHVVQLAHRIPARQKHDTFQVFTWPWLLAAAVGPAQTVCLT